MAESVVSFAVDKLLSFVDAEAKLIGGLPREIEAINNELGSIKAFLKDAEKRAEEDDGIKEWVRQVRNIAYQIEDSIDEYMLLHHDRNRCLRVLVKAIACALQLKPRHNIASTIKNIKAEIHEINRRKECYQFRSTEWSLSGLGGGPPPPTKWQDPRVFSLYVEESELVGIKAPKRNMIRLMDLDRLDVRCSVISVFGMAGIGKTTVVCKVFDDKEVRKHFPPYAWITVPHSYRRVDVLISLLKQFHKAAKESTPREIETLNDEVSILDKLRNYLEGKRYIIVLDDVWEVELCICIKSALPNINNGSKILITTRLENVALAWKASSADHVYNLQPLPPEEAWTLFCKKTFQESCCPREMEEFSHDIVRKCEGLPLAILAIGALLSTKKKTVLVWKKLRDSFSSELGNHPHFTSARRILLLSYHELPYYLKACFLYFGIFPEDYSVDRMRLVRLWIAEGFIKRHREKTLEEVAEEYLTELVHRSLVLVS